MEVILELISPSIDIVGLDIDLERPMWMLLFVAKLIILSQFHYRHSTCVISYFRQMFSDGLSGTIIVHLLQDIAPSILEEIEGRLSVKGEHSEPIG